MTARRTHRQSWWAQFTTLQFRATCAYTRNPANAAGRTVMAVALAVLVGAIFFKRPPGAAPLTCFLPCMQGRTRAKQGGNKQNGPRGFRGEP